MDMNYLDTKFGLMESIMRNTLQKIENLSSKMDMFTDRLVTVERKMLHFERELHIVKLQQSLSGKQPQHRLLPKYVPQHTALPLLPIYNPYFVRPRPVRPPLRPNRTTNQPPITQSALSSQLPAPVPPIVNPDHPPSHSISHSSVDPPDHTSANPPGNSSAQPPWTHMTTFSTIHIMTPLIQRQKIHPILQLLTYSEQKQPDQKELDIVQRIQNSVV